MTDDELIRRALFLVGTERLTDLWLSADFVSLSEAQQFRSDCLELFNRLNEQALTRDRTTDPGPATPSESQEAEA